VVDDGWPSRRAAKRFQVSPTTAKRWADRYRELGEAGMADHSSRPHTSPRRTPTRTDRGLTENLLLRAQLSDLAAQLCEFLLLVADQTRTLSSVHPLRFTQVRMVCADGSYSWGQLLRRAAGADQLHDLTTELRRVRGAGSRHDGLLLAGTSVPKRMAVHQAGATSV
jgi:helix-turn-helix protein